MLMKEALDIINEKTKPRGYMVAFEEFESPGILRSDYFPDKHAKEPLIPTEEEAWELARRFALKTRGRCINVYVINHLFQPVEGYRERIIFNRE